MNEPDPAMVRISQGIELNHAGDRDAAREVFASVWDEIGGESGNPLHVCALAHSMADVQDDVQEELRWDLLALAAADGLTDERAARAGVASPVAGFYPSLHLNLGECYRKLGETETAHEHLAKGMTAVEHLGDDGYGKTVKGALIALSERLDAP